MFIKLTNGTPEIYTIAQLRRDNPNTSMPKDMPAETLQEFDVYKVKQTPAPQIDSKTHRHTHSVELVDNEWTQVWQVVELSLDQATDNTRAHRNYLISQTDWVVAVSYEQQTPVPQAWANYRQLLRDVPQQQGFPYAIIWPVQPEVQ